MMTIQVPGRFIFSVGSYEEASEAYLNDRDQSGDGAATYPPGFITNDESNFIAVVSWDGRVWDMGTDGAVRQEWPEVTR